MTYVKVGPFTDNAAPGISAAFLNGLETWIASVDAPTLTTITGGGSGTANCYEFLNGSIKAFFIDMEAMKTGASNQFWTLPTAFTVGCFFTAGNVDTFSFYHSGGTLNVDILTSLSSTGGSTTSIASAAGNSLGWFIHPFDQFCFNSAAGSAHTGYVFGIGM